MLSDSVLTRLYRRLARGFVGLAASLLVSPIASAQLASASGAAPLLSVTRVAIPAELEQAGRTVALRQRQALQAGDRVATGLYGRAALQLAGSGRIQLGGDSALLIHSAEAPDSSQGGIVRLVLERGAVRLDARTRQGRLPLDYRLNLGRLKLRVFGSEIWAELGPRGENVCLLSGGLEILSADGTERLDRPGECALFGAEGQRLQVLADTGEALPRKLVRTAFADDLGARAAAELTPPPAADLLPFPQPTAASGSPTRQTDGASPP